MAFTELLEGIDLNIKKGQAKAKNIK